MAGKEKKTEKKTGKKGQSIKSKVSKIKKLIALDPFHPGSLSAQQVVKSDGKKSKKYWSWQSSYNGKKYCYRIPDEDVQEVKKLIDNAKMWSKGEEKKGMSTFRSYQKALKELMDSNARARKESGNAIGSDSK